MCVCQCYSTGGGTCILNCNICEQANLIKSGFRYIVSESSNIIIIAGDNLHVRYKAGVNGVDFSYDLRLTQIGD